MCDGQCEQRQRAEEAEQRLDAMLTRVEGALGILTPVVEDDDAPE